jgi:four helix bundle protein
MARAKSFRDLDVYRLSLKEAKRVFDVTKEFPKSETYSLTDQVRRSSRAVGAIVAEAWARRRYKGAFINKLNMAMAEAHETQSWLDHARTCDYIEDEQYADLDDAWQHVGAMLNSMIQNADAFCGQQDVDGKRNA